MLIKKSNFNILSIVHIFILLISFLYIPFSHKLLADALQKKKLLESIARFNTEQNFGVIIIC